MSDGSYWIPGPWPGRLGIVPRPRGGDWFEDEMRRLQLAGGGRSLPVITAPPPWPWLQQ